MEKHGKAKSRVAGQAPGDGKTFPRMRERVPFRVDSRVLLLPPKGCDFGEDLAERARFVEKVKKHDGISRKAFPYLGRQAFGGDSRKFPACGAAGNESFGRGGETGKNGGKPGEPEDSHGVFLDSLRRLSAETQNTQRAVAGSVLRIVEGSANIQRHRVHGEIPAGKIG